MKHLIPLLLFLSALILSGCSEVESDQEVDFSSWEKSYLVYSYPFNGQNNVSVKTNVTLMFSHVLDDVYLESHIQLFDRNNQLVDGDVSIQSDSDKSIIFTPKEDLKEGESYTIRYQGITSEIGEVKSEGDIRFNTIGVSKDADVDGGRDGENPDPLWFHVLQEFPSSNLPFMDFSVIHLTMSHTVDASTVKLDQGFSFTEAGQTQSVPGKLMVKDRYIIFDPKDDLTPGKTYTLKLAPTVKSRSGLLIDDAAYLEKTYVPKSSLPRTTMVQKIQGAADTNISPLSALPRNSVPVNSTLMGDVISFANSNYYTELAFIPNFPDAAPFVIRKGAVIKGSSMPVAIGGQVSAGYTTEEIYLTLITDATGYLINNTNSQDRNAPKQVQLVMDVAMTAQHPKANGGLSQDVLHVNLFGIARTENDVLVVDTVGEINPTLLGVEKAQGMVSFFLEAYADQNNAPARIEDETPPELQSWLPGDIIDRVDPADAVFLIFTEPLSPENLQDEITLVRNGNINVPITVTHDGSSVIVKPHSPLKYNSDYTVYVGGAVMDMAKNPIVAPMTLSFTTLNYDTGALAAPLVGSIYPGYNCQLTAMDLPNLKAGRCAGGKSDDDVFSVFSIPENRNIQITFNQLMDTDTYKLGKACDEGSIRVEKINSAGECLEAVSGSIQYDASRIQFEPSIPWQSATLYRVVLNSAQSSLCDASDDVLCSDIGLPLRTNPLTLTFDNRNQGSGPMSIPFVASAPEQTKVFNPLSKLPAGDVNRNFTHDDSESVVLENSSRLVVNDVDGLVSEARIGCKSGSCPDDEYIFVSGYLPTDVGVHIPAEDHIPVELYSQALMTTSVTMYAKALGIWLENPTGPQVMRMRPRFDDQGNSLPGIGYIYWDPDYDNEYGTKGQAMFKSTMEVYLDAPGLKPKMLGIELDTNMHSLPLTILLNGPIVFLPDGRMEIQLKNEEEVDIGVVIESPLGDSNVDLAIPKGELAITLVSKMVKS
ncbi:MAG: Ig-like domain-containing protein [Gammaproteobacteria bacterium]|nr:Ig-like domain-containing protein [Gammaproteobacteria bacterium]